MYLKILHGFLFGIGLSIAFAISLTLWFSIQTVWSPVAGTTELAGFSELSMEEKLNRSSIVLRTSHSNGKSFISELIKRESSVEFDRDVGDEYYPFGTPSGTQELAGDGDIILLVGSLATPSYSRSYTQYELDRYGNNIEEMLIQEDR